MPVRSYLSIGDVLELLRGEFSDITISKIRFLESQGLVNPERTPAGYRKFYDADVARLRWVLRQQREHFLPLKVIKDRMEREWGAVGHAEPEGSRGVVEPPQEELWGPEDDPIVDLGTTGAAVTERSSSRGGPGPVDGLGPVPQAPPALLDSGPDGALAGRHGGDSAGLQGLSAEDEVSAPAGSASRGVSGNDSESDVDGASWVGPQTLSTSRDAEPATAVGYPPAAPSSANPPAGPSPGDPSTAGSSGTVRSAAASPVEDPFQGGTGPCDGGRRRRAPQRSSRARPAGAGGGRWPDDELADEGGGAGLVHHVAEMSGVSLTLAELARSSGLAPEMVSELESYGLLSGVVVAGTTYYDEEALTVARLSAAFRRFGLEARHLRVYKNAADREAGLLLQLITPLLMQRNPDSRQRALDSLAELSRLGHEMHSALMRAALSPDLRGVRLRG